ncbi:MAG: hypothetical protein JWR80_8028 [Bradyrhizobium sp.]|nr:hypothetical protein [Bradyrhizobium sp.]
MDIQDRGFTGEVKIRQNPYMAQGCVEIVCKCDLYVSTFNSTKGVFEFCIAHSRQIELFLRAAFYIVKSEIFRQAIPQDQLYFRVVLNLVKIHFRNVIRETKERVFFELQEMGISPVVRIPEHSERTRNLMMLLQKCQRNMAASKL